jgi:glycosyltransferase involved in cell wall biosynthesis
MKILFTCNALGVGGSERNVLLHARELDRIGNAVRIHPLVHGGEMEPQAEPWLHRALSGGRDAAEIERKLDAHIRDWKPDVVHAIGCPAEFVTAAVCSRIPGQRWVMAVQDRNLYNDRRAVWTAGAAARSADLVIADGEGTREHAEKFLRFPTQRLRTLVDGVDVEALRPAGDRESLRASLGAAPGDVVIGSVARLDLPKKGQDVLLESFAALGSARARLVLVGDGPAREELQQLASRLGVYDRVTFAGTRSDLGDLLHAFDVLCIASRWESIPKILLEAMAVSCAVVTTSAGDISEVARDRVNALVVPPGDADALRLALNEIVEDPALRAATAAGGRRFIEEGGLTLEGSVEHLVGLYNEILENRRARHTVSPYHPKSLLLRLATRNQLSGVLKYMHASLAPLEREVAS